MAALALLSGFLFMISPVHAAGRTLTIASWNIEHLAAEGSQGCRARDAADYAAIRHYLTQTGADVVAFQEVEDLRAAQQVFAVSDYDIHISTRPTQTFPQCYDAASNRRMQRTGFAVRKDIAARLGLKAVRQPDLRALQGVYKAGRWGVYLILEPVSADNDTSPAPALPTLHLLSIHLKSRCTYQSMSAPKTRTNCHLLSAQIDELSAWINARASLQQDFIIAGDFNRQLDALGDEVWRRLESGGASGQYVDLEKALHGVKHPRPYNRKYPFAIDHIIYNQALDNLMVEEQTHFDVQADEYSDHLPLFAVFDLSRARAASP